MHKVAFLVALINFICYIQKRTGRGMYQNTCEYVQRCDNGNHSQGPPLKCCAYWWNLDSVSLPSIFMDFLFITCYSEKQYSAALGLCVFSLLASTLQYKSITPVRVKNRCQMKLEQQFTSHLRKVSHRYSQRRKLMTPMYARDDNLRGGQSSHSSAHSHTLPPLPAPG